MKRLLGTLAIVVVYFAPGPALTQPAKPEALKIASPYPKDTPIGVALDVFVESLQKKLAGYYDVTIVNQLNSGLDSIKSQNFHLSVVPSTDLNRFSDNAFALYDLPFLFASSKELAAVQQTESGNTPFSAIQKAGIIGLGYLNNGLNNLVIYSTIKDISDLKGRKVNVTSPVSRVALENFGASPIQMRFAELAQAAERGVIDGFESSPALAWTILKEKSRDKSPVTALPIRPNVAAIVVPEATWKALSYRAQVAIKEEAERAELTSTAEADRLEAEAKSLFLQVQLNNRADFGAFYKSAQPSWYFTVGPGGANKLNSALPVIERVRANTPTPVVVPPGRRGSTESQPGTTRQASSMPRGEVLFATDRKVEADTDPRFRVGSNRGQLVFGLTRFDISPNRPLGNVDPGLSTIVGVDALREQSFLARLNDQLSKSSKKDLVVFVHGFNNTFEDAARALALFSQDVNFGAVPILFSWPSDGIALRYPSDEEEVRASRDNFLAFLTLLKNQTAAHQIHVTAHSMGNRLVVETVDRFDLEQRSNRNALFGHLIMAAPDVYPEIFSQTLDAIKRRSKRVTLYVSEKDSALKCSKVLHGNRRLGEAGGVPFVASGIETIDVTNAEPDPRPVWTVGALFNYLIGTACRSGHAYMIRSARVQADVQHLVLNDLPPSNRHGIEEKKAGELTYWQFKRVDETR